MTPTLREGDVLLVPLGDRARPGDVVIVAWPDRPLSVKRLLRREPDGGWWVERDGREGVDSWSIGAVPAAGLHGRVLLRCWPRPGRLPAEPDRAL
jgi:hypothetical protein